MHILPDFKVKENLLLFKHHKLENKSFGSDQCRHVRQEKRKLFKDLKSPFGQQTTDKIFHFIKYK